MNEFNRLNKFMPFIVMAYLLTSLAQMHIAHSGWPHELWPSREDYSIAKVQADLHWYLEQVGKAETNQALLLPSN